MLILRVHEKPGSTPKIVKVERFPCTIGRSLQCEVTVEHQNISAKHAIIEDSGNGFVIRDLNSTNGLSIGISKHQQLFIDQNLTLWMGPVQIDIVVTEPPLERTKEFVYVPERDVEVGGLAAKNIFALALIFLATLFEFNVATYSEKWTDILLSVLSWFFASAFFSGIAALFSKIHNKRYNFFKIFYPINIAFALFIVYSSLEDTILFNLKYESVRSTFVAIAVFSYLFFVSYRLLRVLFERVPRSRLMRNAAISVILLMGLTIGIRILQDKEGQRYDYYGSVGYPLVRFSLPANSVKNLMEQVNDSVDTIKEYRVKVLKEKGLKGK